MSASATARALIIDASANSPARWVSHRADEQDMRDAARQPGLHQAYYDKALPSASSHHAEGTSDLMSYYPQPVKDWIRRNGGLTTR